MRALYDKRRFLDKSKPQELKTKAELRMNLHDELRTFKNTPAPREADARVTKYHLGVKIDKLVKERKRATASMAVEAEYRRNAYIDNMEVQRKAMSPIEKEQVTRVVNSGAITLSPTELHNFRHKSK